MPDTRRGHEMEELETEKTTLEYSFLNIYSTKILCKC